MPKYRVALNARVSLSVTVEADNEDEARDAAYEKIPGGLCAQCSGWGREYSMDLEEFDVDEDVTASDGTVFSAVQQLEV